jgi:hypothetical protein
VILNGADPRPVLLIDVDGVLNPWLAPECPPGFGVYDFFPGERVLLSPGHGELLTSLASAYELVWATAWEHRANKFISPVLSLPELPVIEFPLDGRDEFFRKLPRSSTPSATGPARGSMTSTSPIIAPGQSSAGCQR